MRKVIKSQMQIGEIGVENVEIDLNSRDEIPKILFGLQYIYVTPDVRNEIFAILEELVPEGIDQNNGCPGMDLWKILVLGTIRLGCNWDYDKLQEIANNHHTLRQMLGHGVVDNEYRYALQTLKDNLRLFTPEILGKIINVVVESGHSLIMSKDDESLRGRCDSFVVETNVHFPTDINLLYDSVRKVIEHSVKMANTAGMPDWRQSKYNIRQIKRAYRKAQNTKKSTSKDEARKEKQQKLIEQAHQDYIELASSFIEKAEKTIQVIENKEIVKEQEIDETKKYIEHAKRQIDQIKRRVLLSEVIPHAEKVFSIFEEHTEWISKGKAGVPVELGLRVCILEDQYGFILHHHVMENQVDTAVTVSMVKSTQEKFPNLNSCSFDKGFYSSVIKKELMGMLAKVILPKKGKLSKKDKEIEHSEEFIKAKHQHSAVESAVNGLENSGLDICPDHGIDGFKRYVALAVLARNIQTLGHIVQQRQLKSQKQREKYQATLLLKKQAV